LSLYRRDLQKNNKAERIYTSEPPTIVYKMALSRDGKTLAFSDRLKRVTVWDSTTGTIRKEIDFSPAHVSEVAMSLNGDMLAAFVQESAKVQRIHVIDARTGKDRAVLLDPQKTVMALAFSSDGQTILSIGSSKESNEIRSWILKTMNQNPPLNPKNHVPMGFSPDGGVAVCSSPPKDDKGVFFAFWDTKAQKEINRITLQEGVRASLGSTAISPDNKLFAFSWGDAATKRRVITICDIATGKMLFDHPASSIEQAIVSLAFSLDGRILVFSSSELRKNGDQHAILWRFKTPLRP